MLVLVAELFIYAPHIQGQRSDPFNPPPYIDFLKNDTGIYRVTGFNNILYPNIATAYQVSDIREKDPLEVSRYMVFLQKVMGAPPGLRYDGVYQDINYRALDLMNVKYVLSTSDIGTLARGNLVSEISCRMVTIYHPEKIGRVYTSRVEGKYAIIASAPTRIDYTLTVPDNAENFTISAGMHPDSWNKTGGDGVNFTVHLISARGDEEVFSRTLDPAHRSEDRKWYTQEIDVTPYRGQTVHLLLVTDPRGNSVGDEGAAWGDPGLETTDTLRKASDLEQS